MLLDIIQVTHCLDTILTTNTFCLELSSPYKGRKMGNFQFLITLTHISTHLLSILTVLNYLAVSSKPQHLLSATSVINLVCRWEKRLSDVFLQKGSQLTVLISNKNGIKRQQRAANINYWSNPKYYLR